MASPVALFPADDKDLDDATLWAAIDSAAASHSSKNREPLAIKCFAHHQTLSPISNASPHTPRVSKLPRSAIDGEVLQENWTDHRGHKAARSEICESRSPALALVKHVQRTPTTPVDSSLETATFFTKGRVVSPFCSSENEDKHSVRHSLSGQFPSVSLFKEYQNAAMAILEKSDYIIISGSPFIKKSGWRKISFYFNISYEIKDKSIEFDENRHVQRAEFVVRAHMQSGRFSDGWGSCERREKRFLKANHDIPCTAETRAKNRACQDLVGIGEYRPGANHASR